MNIQDEPGIRRNGQSHFAQLATVFLLMAFLIGTSVAQTTNTLPTYPVSLKDALDIAVRQSPRILKARKDVEANAGVVIQTRAVVLPKLRVSGSYGAVEPSDVDKPPVDIPGFSFGTDQSWGSQIKLVQSIYEGGRMASALRSIKLLKQQALLDYQTAVADTILAVEISYYNNLLAAEQINVQQASVELLQSELADTRRRFDAGTVPRFNVLRAEVELANAQPRLIRARNDLRIARNNLANLLGFDIPPDAVEQIPLQLSGRLEATELKIDLHEAIRVALERRPELKALRNTTALRKEDVITARAGYKPSLQAFGGYEGHSSMFSDDLGRELHGWMAGVQLSWDLFDGGLTWGRVKQATAVLERSEIELADSQRNIELEVRTAFSNFIEAREVLESQKKVVEQAEEALRLASARSQAGSGTQLDVLSAQTALTEARNTQVQALRDYSTARARLERAMGANIPVLVTAP